MGGELGQRLKALRRGQRVTLQELARDLGVHFTTVSAWERGRSQPDLQVLQRLATRLGVGLAELVGAGEAARPRLRLAAWGRSRWEGFMNRTEALQLAAALLRRPDPPAPSDMQQLQEALAGERPSVTGLLRLGSRYDVQTAEAPAWTARRGGPEPERIAGRLNGMPGEMRAAAVDLLVEWLDLVDPPAPDGGPITPRPEPRERPRRRRSPPGPKP